MTDLRLHQLRLGKSTFPAAIDAAVRTNITEHAIGFRGFEHEGAPSASWAMLGCATVRQLRFQVGNTPFQRGDTVR